MVKYKKGGRIMSFKMTIHNIKSIIDFTFEIPTQKGLYALTGENASGKSTIISCASTAFYNPLLYSYFGEQYDGSKIEFEFDRRMRSITSNGNRWYDARGNLGITGFFEGSLVFGNRFKDVDFKLLKKLSSVTEDNYIFPLTHNSSLSEKTQKPSEHSLYDIIPSRNAITYCIYRHTPFRKVPRAIVL